MTDEHGSGDTDGKTPERGRIGPRGRVQLRAAFALEEAGELEEAARLFEHVGEHSQAAALRLEHAQTLRDEQQRLAVLREGAARNPADTDQGAALHRSLARALLVHVEGTEDGARRRGLLVEAAQALEAGGNASDAGEIYENLGMLTRAATSYERAGEISKLELVLALLEREDQAKEALRQLEGDVDEAWRSGDRALARTLIAEHVRDAQRRRCAPLLTLSRRLADLERALPRRRRVHLQWRDKDGTDRLVHVHLGDNLRIGRAPDCDVHVNGATLSREHVTLRADDDADGRPRICAIDSGTPAGTFWAGEPLVPGEAVSLEDRAELGLGFANTIEVVPIPGRSGTIGALVGGTDRDWVLFLPRGGPLLLDPGRLAPATVEARGDFVLLRASTNTRTWLEDHPLGGAATVELLVHDRLRIEANGEPRVLLEVVG